MKYQVDDEFLYKYMLQAEESMLKQLPEEETICHEFSNEFSENMNELLRQEKKKGLKKNTLRVVRIAAVFLAVFLAVKSWAFIRERFQVMPDKTTYIPSGFVTRQPVYIPKGFTVLEQQGDEKEYRIEYGNEFQQTIQYCQRPLGEEELDFDSEKVDVIGIEGNQVFVERREDHIQLCWEEEGCIYTIAGNVDESELVKMCRSVME